MGEEVQTNVIEFDSPTLKLPKDGTQASPFDCWSFPGPSATTADTCRKAHFFGACLLLAKLSLFTDFGESCLLFQKVAGE